MSESEFVTAVNEDTGIVSAIPRHYLGVYPQYKELSEAQIIELRRNAEKLMFGETITPSTRSKAGQELIAAATAESAQPAQAVAAAESPAKEGGN